MNLPDDDLRAVDAPTEVLADLRYKCDNVYDSHDLAEHAKTLGIHPPKGFPAVEIVVAFPPDGPDDGILAWLGPDTSGQGESQ